jgi:type I restriction enzyme M protein
MSNVTHDIVAKLWNLCNVLKDDGVTYHQYVTELTYLLFLKMAEETETESQIPEGYRWRDLISKEGVEQLESYKVQLIHLGTNGSHLVQEIFANASSFIKKPKNLKALTTSIEKLDWYSARQEGLGDLYEGLLEKNANEKKSGAGQYFTPRPLIQAMVEVMKPEAGEIIQDPAAGTGGFLIMADRYIKERTDDLFSLSEKKQVFQRSQAFYGMEHVQDTHRLALMNMMLHGMDEKGTGMRYGDTLSPDGENLPKADLILTNPPFGTKQGGGLPTREDFTFPTANKQFAFLQHIYRGLKPGGRAAVVMPDNVLFEGNVGKKIREDLMHKCNLHTILRLPTGIFYAQGVKTNVLFFTKGKKDKDQTQNLSVYDMRTNMPQFGKRTPFTFDYFTDFIKAYGNDPHGGSKRTDQGEEGRFRCFSRELIAEAGNSLDISWLKDESVSNQEELPEPDELAAAAIAELEGAVGELNSVLELLSTEESA